MRIENLQRLKELTQIRENILSELKRHDQYIDSDAEIDAEDLSTQKIHICIEPGRLAKTYFSINSKVMLDCIKQNTVALQQDLQKIEAEIETL